MDRYYDDGETGGSAGQKRRAYKLKLIGADKIETTVAKYPTSHFVKCQSAPSVAIENDKAPSAKFERPQTADSAAGSHANSAPRDRSNFTGNAGATSREIADNEAFFAKDASDCVTPQKDFILLRNDQSALLGKLACRGDQASSTVSGTTMNVSTSLVCSDGTTPKVDISYTKTLFFPNIVASVSLSGTKAEHYYVCAAVRKAVRDGFRADLVQQYHVALTKAQIKDLYDPYLYVKLCEDGGYTNEAAEVRGFLSEIDGIAHKSGFDTEGIWSKLVAEKNNEETFIILKAGLAAVKSGAGSPLDTIAFRKGCDRFIGIYRSVMREFAEAKQGGPKESFKKDF